MDGNTLCALLDVLKALEQTPMKQLFGGHSKTVGSVVRYEPDTIDQGFTREARQRLSDMQIIEDEIIRIRIDSRTRVYAWRGHHNVFNLIWWDPEHEIYPSQP